MNLSYSRKAANYLFVRGRPPESETEQMAAAQQPETHIVVSLPAVERDTTLKALAHAKGNRIQAAELLGICRAILVVSLLGGVLAILNPGQVRSTPVKASGTGQKIELPSTRPSQVLPKEPNSETAPLRTALPQLAAGLTYLQLSATHRQSAALMVDDLRRKKFDAVASEIEGRPGLFRVLVGPVMDTGVLQLRANLERAGFLGNAAIRRILAESNPPIPDNAIFLSARTTKEGISSRPVAAQTYLELSTASLDSAQRLVEALRQKKFNAMASEIIEQPGLFRVLVGPVEDTGTGIVQMQADLESAGFPSNAAIRRIPAGSDPAKPDAVKSSSDGSTKADAGNRPVAGQTYLELSSASLDSAQRLVEALRQKQFSAMASEIIEQPGVFRVLVGPVEDTGTGIVQMRADLESAGFPSNAAIRRIPAGSGLASPDAVKSSSDRSTKADASNRPVAGQTYLEFDATSAQTAEIIAGALHEKGFEAIPSEIEEASGGFRVLVRPANDTSIDQLRADLQRAGFHADAAILRTLK